jgi:hypothetical protein
VRCDLIQLSVLGPPYIPKAGYGHTGIFIQAGPCNHQSLDKRIEASIPYAQYLPWTWVPNPGRLKLRPQGYRTLGGAKSQ